MFAALTDNKPLVELFDEMQGGVSHGICSAGALVLNVAAWIWDNQLGRVSVCQHRCPQSIADNHQVLWNFQRRLHYSWDTLDLPSGKVSQIRKIKGSYPFLVQQYILQAIHNLERVRVMHWELGAYCRTQEQRSTHPTPPVWNQDFTAWYGQWHQWYQQTFSLFSREDQQLHGHVAFARSDKGRGFLISVHAYSRWHLEYKQLCVEKWNKTLFYKDYKKQFPYQWFKFY